MILEEMLKSFEFVVIIKFVPFNFLTVKVAHANFLNAKFSAYLRAVTFAIVYCR